MFTMLIPGTADNIVKEFELFIGNDSPTGPFESLGKFRTQNIKLFKTPYQEFKFPAIKAKYLKIKLLSTYGWPHPDVPEVQLFGSVDNFMERSAIADDCFTAPLRADFSPPGSYLAVGFLE